MDISLAFKPQKPSLIPKQTNIKADPKRDWNAIMKNHAKLKNDHAILSTYTQMESLGIAPNNTTLPLIFKACARLNAVEKGRRIHSSIQGTNLVTDVRVGTAVVNFYCKCGLLEEANQVFDKITHRDLVSWNAIISGFVCCGFHEEAIGWFRKMKNEGFVPNSRTLVALLLACEGVLELRLGKEIHGYCLRNGDFDMHPHVGTALIGFYLNFDVRVSSLVFDFMVMRSEVSWNAMITGYFDSGNSVKALELFVRILEDGIKIDLVTILVVIQACADFGYLKLGMTVHQMAIKFSYSNDLFIVNALLNMYSEVGSSELACELFDTTTVRDVALWNSMISAYIEYGCYEEAINVFNRMQEEISPDERTIVVLLSLCRELDDGLKKGKSLHAHACKSGMRMDVSVGNAFLSMYTDLSCVEAARKVFSEMTDVDVISYNTLILALASANLKGEAWELFQIMQASQVKPNSHTMISLLATCGDETCLKVGRSIHGFTIKHGFEINLPLNTAFTDMYMNGGDEAKARSLFEACLTRDLISWNAMIANYIKINQTNEALLFFNRMISEVEPNLITIINVLSACTNLANLPQGRCLHGYAIRRFSPSGSNLSLANAIITMYTRSGSMLTAEKIFKSLPRRNAISWNAMITGYGTNGRGCDAIIAFKQMLEDGFQPNEVTFLSVLSACRHAGMIEQGLELFYSMVRDFTMIPALAHYGCVVDLLGRGGCLDEAGEFINSMPIEPDASVWRALLSACRLHSNPKLASSIFENLVKLEPTNAGNYVLLSNIYAEAGLWSEVRQIRTLLKEKGLRKPPGTSWIVIRDQIHCFTAADTSHPQSDKIYANLNSLLTLIREPGYVTDFHLVWHDEED
ncbi:unnamed protein product [Dovyalis caffra]|uniref:Chlororespiratory reduction 21 n=1 Tax=Dovyalis caffra TaxID=77055 RepID=A0AAV1RC48_9ROSI|nr:unnamed protein product [Dovyalis caffra]